MIYDRWLVSLLQFLCAFTWVIGVSLTAACWAEGDFQPLLNGRDLEGWDYDKRIWSVEDGLLTGETRDAADLDHNTFAIWQGGEVEDFELRVVFRLEGDNNSGVQYRSQRVPDLDWAVAGYQADIHPAPNYTAMLYDERGRGILAERGQKVSINSVGDKNVESLPGTVTPVEIGQWNELVIRAVGNRLIHRLNDKVTVDVVDEDSKHADVRGLLALQVHAGPPMKVQFKSVELKVIAKRRGVNHAGEENAASRLKSQPTSGE